MALDLELLSPNDRPALLALSTNDIQELAMSALTELGYKVHTAGSHEEFQERFNRIQYQVVMIEDSFGGVLPEQNEALINLQGMQMNLRRHATIFLVGDLFETLNPMHAFHQSVHAVINRIDCDKLSLILQQVIHDNGMFLSAYRDAATRIAQSAGK
jgi:hypothetical protein